MCYSHKAGNLIRGGGGGDPNKSAVGEGFFEKKNRRGGCLLGNRE